MIGIVVFAIIMIDTSFSRISDLSFGLLNSKVWVVVYIVLTILAFSLQYILLLSTISKSRSIEINRHRSFRVLNRTVIGLQVLLTAIPLYIFYQMLSVSFYDTVLLILFITITYATTMLILAILTSKFFNWLNVQRSLILVLYGLSSAALFASCLITVIFTDQVLLVKPDYIREHAQISFYIRPNSIFSNLSLAFTISSVVSFLLTWVATVSMLHYYSKVLGRIMYWLTVALPLFYFLLQFVNLEGFKSNIDPVLFGTILTLFFSFSRLVGGILFGIAFWLVIRKLKKNSLRDYMSLAAFGVAFTFIANQGIILSSAFYPPFGLVTVSFLTVSSLMMLVGIYSSATSVAKNIAVRQSIRELALNESKFLSVMGFAEMSREIEKKVMVMLKTKKGILDQPEIGTELEKEEVVEYLQTVMEEIKLHERRSGRNGKE